MLRKTNTYIFTTVIIATALLFTSCGDTGTGSTGPSTKTTKGQLSVDLPSYMELSSFTVIASENFGSKVDPEIQARFKAGAKITEPLYMETGRIDGKSILAQTLAKGHDIRIAGKYKAELRGERWVVAFQEVQVTPNIVDNPLSNWNAGRYVFEGSEDEKALRAASEQKRLARIKAEEERKRVEAEERQKTARLKAKLAAEKSARDKDEARKRAAEQRSQMLALENKRKAQNSAKAAKQAAFRKEITGQWEAVTPVHDRDEDVYTYSSSPQCNTGRIKFSMTIPAGEYETVAGSFSVFMPDNPIIRKDTEATIIADGETSAIKVTFPPFYLMCKKSNNNTYKMYQALGEPWKGVVRNGEVKLIGGRRRTITMRKIGG